MFTSIKKAVVAVLVVVMLLGLMACGSSETNNHTPSGSQTPSSGSANSQNVSAQPQQVETTPAVASDIVGIWVDSPIVYVFYPNRAVLYEFGSAEFGGVEISAVKEMYDCSYACGGDRLDISAYDMDGELVYTFENTLNGNSFLDDTHEYVKVSDNVGIKGDLTGTWHALSDEFQFGGGSSSPSAFWGTKMRFFDDGTCYSSWDDGYGVDDGKYYLTTKYDYPAICLIDQYGFEVDTYRYEFLHNDLLIIYSYESDEISGGVVFYRTS